jgi:hypothetical protein
MNLKRMILVAGLAVAVRAEGVAGIEVEVRSLGGEWKTFSAATTVRAGTPGSGVALDGLSVRIPGAKVEVLPYVEGKPVPTVWKIAGQPVGIEGKRLEGLILRVNKGWIRYRASFVGAGVTDWVDGGGAIGEPGGSLFLESLELEYREIPPERAKFEFRAAFRGSGFTPWLPVGSVAEGKGDKPALVALEIRSVYDIRYEIFTRTSSWTSLVGQGQTAGDPDGKDGAKSVRVLGGEARLALRVKQGSKEWGGWCYDGQSCGEIESARDITAVQIAREASPK